MAKPRRIVHVARMEDARNTNVYINYSENPNGGEFIWAEMGGLY
jgi:hypothetical protein